MIGNDVAALLSIDGGGARGILPGTILQCIEEDYKFSFSNSIDYFASASVGNMYTCAFAKPNPQTAATVNQVFKDNVGKIFYKPGICHSLWALFHVDYGPAALQNVLQAQFGDLKFNDLIKPVFTPSTNYTDSACPFHFDSSDKHSWPKNLSVVQTIRCATAAATYFPPVEITDEGRTALFGDGGLYCNNPTASAYTHFSDKLLAKRKVVVLSLGTGLPEQSITYAEAKDWGELKWVSGPLINYIFNATSQQAHMDMQKAADGLNAQSEGRVTYLRLQDLKLPKDHSTLNDGTPEAIQFFEERGKKIYNAHENRIEEVIRTIGK